MINTINVPGAYSEVYAFINILGNDYINKIPTKVYNAIKDNRDINYNPQFNKDQIIEKNDISQEALSLIAALNLQYWCTDLQEKNDLKKAYLDNTKKEDEKYSYENVFKTNENNTTSVINEEKVDNSVAMVEYKESVFVKIKNWIKKFFNRY